MLPGFIELRLGFRGLGFTFQGISPTSTQACSLCLQGHDMEVRKNETINPKP